MKSCWMMVNETFRKTTDFPPQCIFSVTRTSGFYVNTLLFSLQELIVVIKQRNHAIMKQFYSYYGYIRVVFKSIASRRILADLILR